MLLSTMVRSFSTAPSCLSLRYQVLSNRCAISIRGQESDVFLQGLVTNDVHHLQDRDNKKRSMYAMFLNLQGRVLNDVIVFRGNREDQLVLDCDQSLAKGLMRHLKMYKLRRKLDLSLLDSHQTLAVFNLNAGNTTSVEAASTNDHPGFVHCDKGLGVVNGKLKAKGEDTLSTVDPRLHELGYRLIVPKETEPFEDDIEETKEDLFTELRYRLGVAEGADEIPPGKCFPLEYNADYLHGVSFHKGCYIGQELTARVHHTGVVRKRIMPVRFESEVKDVEVDSNFTNEKDKRIGKLRGLNGTRALGLMRIEESLAAEKVNLAGNQAAEVTKPHWWPQEAPKTKQIKDDGA